MNKADLTVTALVPCYNEATRISRVLNVLTKSHYVSKVVVVNDGSTDNSRLVIQKFKEVTLVDLSQNRGKGNAIREGLKKIISPLTFMCDADIDGLTDREIYKMIEPFETEGVDICVGVRKRWGAVGQFLRRNVFPLIAGERVIKTELLRKISALPLFEGWGVEVCINRYVKRKKRKMKKVDLEGVMDPLQFKKVGLMIYFRRLFTLLSLYWRVYDLKIE